MTNVLYSLFAVTTLDGKIAKNKKHFTNWSSKEDKKFLRSHLAKSDAVIVGRNTFEVSRSPLSKRNCIVLTSKVRGIEQKNPNLVFINPENANLHEFVKRKKYSAVAVLGGTKCFNYFLENNLIGNIFLTIEPIIFGQGLPLFSSAHAFSGLELFSIKKLNKKGTILLHYKARK